MSTRELKNSINAQLGSIPNNRSAGRSRWEKKPHPIRWKFQKLCCYRGEEEGTRVFSCVHRHLLLRGKDISISTLSKSLYLQASQEVWGVGEMHYARLNCKTRFCWNFSCGIYPVKAELFAFHNKKNPVEVLIWKFGYKASSVLLMVNPSSAIPKFRAWGKWVQGTQKQAVGRKASLFTGHNVATWPHFPLLIDLLHLPFPSSTAWTKGALRKISQQEHSM